MKLSEPQTNTPNNSRKFGGRYRIKRRADFEQLQKGGKKLYARSFLLVARPSPTGVSRIGIAVTKKVAPHAVDRNRIKRRLKEIFRHIRTQLTEPIDIVVVARRESISCSFAEMRKQVLGTLKHHRFLRGGGTREEPADG